MRKLFVATIIMMSAPLYGQAQDLVTEMSDEQTADSIDVVTEEPQDRLDTIYYNRNWRVTSKPSFAEYYRLALYPVDEEMPREFRTYYMTGEREGEGSFIELDKNDDRKSIFDGEVLRYYKSGSLQERAVYDQGVLTDVHISYYENGNICEYAKMNKGKMDGLVKRFTEDGQICSYVPYQDGVEEGYYVTVDIDGNYTKYDLATQQPILEQPTLAEVQTEYKNGVAWPYYNRNGLIIGVSNSIVPEMGGLREIGFYVFNKSLINVDIDPSKVEVYTMKDEKRIDFELMPASEYDEKVLKGKKKQEKAKVKNKALVTAERENNVNTNLGMQGLNAGQQGNVKVFQERSIAIQKLMGTAANQTLSQHEAEDLGYFERTTVHQGEAVSAFIYKKQKKVPVLYVKLNLGGIDYLYEWVSEGKK